MCHHCELFVFSGVYTWVILSINAATDLNSNKFSLAPFQGNNHYLNKKKKTIDIKTNTVCTVDTQNRRGGRNQHCACRRALSLKSQHRIWSESLLKLLPNNNNEINENPRAHIRARSHTSHIPLQQWPLNIHIEKYNILHSTFICSGACNKIYECHRKPTFNSRFLAVDGFCTRSTHSPIAYGNDNKIRTMTMLFLYFIEILNVFCARNAVDNGTSIFSCDKLAAMLLNQ